MPTIGNQDVLIRRCNQRIVTGIENFHLLFGAIRLLEYILLIMEQIAWVSRWFVLKKYIVQIFLFRHSRNLLLYNVCTTTLTWYNRWMVSFVDTICYFLKIRWQKKSNLMILDNSGKYYSRMLLFVLGFLVYWKTEPNSLASGNTWFTIWLQTGHVKVVTKTKCDVKNNNF